MNTQRLIDTISQLYGPELSNDLIESFQKTEEEFALQKWLACIVNAGHFVEHFRKILEVELFNVQPSRNIKLSKFSDSEINRYAQVANKSEFLRISIPRCLRSIYEIRNKRGAAHSSNEVSANMMDANLVMIQAKWALGEMLRLKASIPIYDLQSIIDSISSRNLSVLWKDQDVCRVIVPDISAENKVLIHLFDESPLDAKTLLTRIEYKNSSRFREILIKLHSERYIEYNKTKDECRISPLGITKIEKIILEYRLA